MLPLPFSTRFQPGSGTEVSNTTSFAISAERYNSIMHSLKRKMLPLPFSTRFLPGSGTEVSNTTSFAISVERYNSIMHSLKRKMLPLPFSRVPVRKSLTLQALPFLRKDTTQ
ncbi:unnamed protein product [Macrosiphum euphorbiae]|uniref:Uncharacterized protein n=1 Tax=Macrosiphum euphorbiae TaxID=13131 RepID=A0AAV0XST8_9HEMI|nr:unnamed protein product [Macrosiphum euphorbiae]